MKLPDELLRILNLHGGLLTSKDVSNAGFSRTTLGNYVKQGVLERTGRGRYIAPGTIADELFLLSIQQPRLVFSHMTALFLHGLSERTPFKHYATIDSATTISSSLRSKIQCFYVAKRAFGIGLTKVKTPFGNEVRCYDVERTVCDLIRSRSRLDDESVLNGLRNYARSKKDLVKLANYAERLGIAKRVKETLEILL